MSLEIFYSFSTSFCVSLFLRRKEVFSLFPRPLFTAVRRRFLASARMSMCCSLGLEIRSGWYGSEEGFQSHSTRSYLPTPVLHVCVYYLPLSLSKLLMDSRPVPVPRDSEGRVEKGRRTISYSLLDSPHFLFWRCFCFIHLVPRPQAPQKPPELKPKELDLWLSPISLSIHVYTQILIRYMLRLSPRRKL